MISDKRLIQISLVTSVVGLIALYIIVSLTEPVTAPLSELKAGQNVLVSGAVEGYKEGNGAVFFTLQNVSTVKVVVFGAGLKITNGDNVTVKGKTQFYKNELEVIAKDVRKN